MIFPYQYEGEPGPVYRDSYKKIVNRDSIREQSVLLQEILCEVSYDGEYWITDWGAALPTEALSRTAASAVPLSWKTSSKTMKLLHQWESFMRRIC